MDDSILSTVDEPDSDGDIADDESQVSCEGDEEFVSDPPAKKKCERGSDSGGEQRRSRRLASKPENRQREKLQSYGLIKGEKLWRDMEKKLFLQACKEHGTDQVERIIEKLPSKAPDTIKSMIHREKKNQNYTIETRFEEEDGSSVIIDDGENTRRSRRGEPIDLPSATPRGQIVEILRRRQRNAPIEKWIDVVEGRVQDQGKKMKAEGSNLSSDYSSIVPTMLQWISEQEPHPPPEDCRGVDYASIYHYLACLCKGEAPPDLNLETSERVRKLIPSLVSVLKQHSLDKETDYLENYRGAQTKYRCEEDYDGNSGAAANIVELSQVPGINPLHLHPEMFTEKQIPRLDDLISITSEEAMETEL